MCMGTKLGREPTFLELFLDTHLTKECKKRFWAGELNVKILEGLNFCTDRAKEAYTACLQEMTKEYGLNFSRDDANVWARVQPNGSKPIARKKRVYGIGSSDLHFVVTGTPSSHGIASHVDQESQQKLQDLEARLEAEKKAIEDLEQQMQKKMDDFMKKFNAPSN